MTALFDRERLLLQCAGDNGLVGAVLESYWADAEPIFETLSIALVHADRQGLKYQAHTLSGLALYICSDELRDAAFHLEQIAMTGSESELELAAAAVRNVHGLLRDHAF